MVYDSEVLFVLRLPFGSETLRVEDRAEGSDRRKFRQESFCVFLSETGH